MLSWFRSLVLLLLLPLSALAQDKAEIFLQLGHSDSVNTVVFSPDGRTVASGSHDKTIKVWDVASGRELRTLSGHSKLVSAIVFFPDRRTLASASNDATIKLWDAATGHELRTLKGHNSWIRAIAISPDGRTLASASNDTTVKLWQVANGQELRTLRGHSDAVFAVAFSPDGRTVVSGSSDSTLKLWDVATGRELHTLRGHGIFSVNAVAFSPDGRTVVSGGGNTLKLWDVASGREIRTLSGHGGTVETAAFFSDGRLIVSGGQDNTLRLWAAVSGRELRTLRGHGSFVKTVAVSPDGRTLASGSFDKTLKLWDVTSGRELHTLSGHVSSVGAVALSSDGYTMASNGHDNTLKLWDVVSGRMLRVLSGHTDAVKDIAFSPDGHAAMSVSRDMTLKRVIKLWNVATGRELRTFTIGSSQMNLHPLELAFSSAFSVDSVSFLSDGLMLHVGSEDNLLKLRDVSNQRILRTLIGHSEYVSAVAFSTDGRLLASGGADNTLRLWDVESGRELHTLVGHARSVSAVAFSPDGRIVVSGSFDKTLKLWDVATGQKLRTLSGHSDGVRTASFSPDGRMVVSGSDDKTIKLWNVGSGRELRTLSGHHSWVFDVAFSPDGRTVVSGSQDGSIRLWDAATGSEKAMLVGFKDDGWIAMTPQGYYMGSEKADQYVNVRIGNKVYGVDQYREKFYRPEIVQAALAGKPITGLASLTSVKPAPSVSIVETPASVGNDEATVKVKVADEGGGIGDVRLYLNGSAVVLDRTRNLAVSKVQGKAQTFSYKVRLVPGKNAIRAIAFNAENSMQSMDALHKIEAKISPKKPSLHALVIGIQEYENPKLTLKYPAADAKLMATTLREQAAGLFERVNVVELTAKSQTTKEAIAKTLKEMSEKVWPDDLFVFFVASHGTVDEGEYYLITSNVGALSSHILKKSALSQDDLKAMIANVPATKKLVIIDTCNAGKLGEAIHVAMLTRGMNEETAMKILSRAVGSTVLSASNSVQEALEGYKDHGLFTWVVTEGLRGAADSDKDGYVKTHELVNYVDDTVPVVAEQVFKHKQYPTTTLSGQGFPVVRVK